MAPPASTLPETYATTLQEIETHLRNARIRAILAANPIGVAAYQLQSKLPAELKGKLPTAKQLAQLVRVEMDCGR